MKIAYFPGCTLKTKAIGLDNSVRDTARFLGYELVEVPDWTCCGASFNFAVDNIMALAPPIRILANARKLGNQVITVCAGCYNVLKRANYTVRNDPGKLATITDFIEMEYKGDVEVVHYLEFLRDRVGYEKIRSKVSVDLSRLRVVPYYGCQLLRPAKELNFDDPEAPTIMDDLLDAIGCKLIDFPHKTECCGAFLTVCGDLEPGSDPIREDAEFAVSECSYTILNSAARSEADLIALSCPLCLYNLDFLQDRISKTHFGFRKIPVVYFSQLLGIALGLDLSNYGLDSDHHFVDPSPVLLSRYSAK
ncbi:MAG: CoB--CoM heterodisulfide reductase iron-sulfur subunit B family protein [bacterium]